MSSKSFTPKEGLHLPRLLMVLSSMSPLFLLWAIRGNCPILNSCFIQVCDTFVLFNLGMTVAPTLFLMWWMRRAQRQKDQHERVAGHTEDHSSHILVYLFAILLPIYQEDLESLRELAATIVALMFITYLFYRLNLHYINFLFVIQDYHVFTVSSPPDDNPYSGKETFVLITHRRFLSAGECIYAYRLSNSVYLETQE